MRDVTDVRIRRGLLVLAAVLVCLAMAPPALAVEKTVNFLPGTDISSWYWERQVDEEVTTPVTLPPPLPAASQRARLPNPQRPDTIPVALNNGASERMSAIRFDLVAEDRGVIEGSKIKKALLFVEESLDRNEQPQVSPEAAKIQACQILDFLPQGEEERYKDAPKYDDKACADGTRETSSGAPTVWTFDLTKIAQEWGKNPFDNNGVMLVPVLEPGKTWQVNLKVPRKDAAAEEGDQYELTKSRTVLSIDFIPGEPPEIPEAPSTDSTTTTPPSTSTGTSSIPSSGLGSTGTSPVISPSTDLTGADAGATAPAVAPTEQAGLALPQEQGPRMPAYVWLAIPLGLLALSAVRSVVLEPVGGPRPDGVIAAIRRRNAERRGASLGGRTRVLSGVSGGFRRGAGKVGKTLSGVTKIVRRKR
ncbi:MAG: hypothetical protein ACRDH9_08080 [Actinomycetota bacterium]